MAVRPKLADEGTLVYQPREQVACFAVLRYLFARLVINVSPI